METCTITRNARFCQLVNAMMLMNTLEIRRGTSGNFPPLSGTTSACVSLHTDLYHYFDLALSPTCERYNVNEHPRNPSGYYSWLLRLASIFLENYTITWNARYRQLVNAIMLMNTVVILRGTSVTFDHYRWLLRLASIFIETYTITWNARYRQLVNTIMLMNTLAILRGTFGNFRPLSLTTLTCVSLHRDLYHYLERALSPTCEHYNVNEHPRNPSGYFR